MSKYMDEFWRTDGRSRRIISKEELCPECQGRTVMFSGKGLNTQYEICSRYKEPGHKTGEEINKEIYRVQRAIRPSGRLA